MASVIGRGAPSDGVYTVEGNQAGALAGRLASQRAAASAAVAKQRDAISAESARVSADGDRFASAATSTSVVDAALRATTVGLLSISEFRSAQAEAEAAAHRATAPPPPPPAARTATAAAASAVGAKRKRAPASLLSFVDEVDGDDSNGPPPLPASRPATTGASTTSDTVPAPGGVTSTTAASKTMVKDPTVATSFLPDATREAMEAELRSKLAAEWAATQDAEKREKLEVVYSYWDGSGHRRSIIVPKGTSIGRFLEWVRQDLMPSFPELRTVSSGEGV